jgi:alpha-L-fucosidase
MPFYYTDNDTNWNTTHIFEYIGVLNSSKTLASISLPDTSNTSTGSRLHVFSMSLWKGDGIQIQNVRPTQKTSGDRVQTVEVLVNNAGTEWIAGEGVNISIKAPGIMTVEPAIIKRLRPGDQKKVKISVIGCGSVSGDIVFTGSMNKTYPFEATNFGLEEFTSELSSLTLHESPDWFDSQFIYTIKREEQKLTTFRCKVWNFHPLRTLFCTWVG